MVSVIPCDVHYATSADPEHPPSNITDFDESSFWVSTGMYPQEVALKFKVPSQITRITYVTGKAKTITIYSAKNAELTEWNEIYQHSLPALPIKQLELLQLNLHDTSHGIKIFIGQGWGPFIAVYNIKVEGPPARG
jgi:heat shock protein beta-11